MNCKYQLPEDVFFEMPASSVDLNDEKQVAELIDRVMSEPLSLGRKNMNNRWRCRCGDKGNLAERDFIGGTLQLDVCAACYEELLERKNALVVENNEFIIQLGEKVREMEKLAQQLVELQRNQNETMRSHQ